MTKKITAISPHKAALTLSLTIAALTLLIVAPIMIYIRLSPGHETNIPLIVSIVVPFIYLISTYILVFIGALLFNLMAKLTGGISMTVQ